MRGIRGITLVALVITIIVLLILATISISLVLGKNGLINKTKYAKEETNKQTATEKINLKITTAQVDKYTEEQRMPALKELSLVLSSDNEIEYVTQISQIASKKYEVGDNPTSIFTKLNEYPYEFEINAQLQLASINGIKIATAETKKIEELMEEIERLTEENRKLKSDNRRSLGTFFGWKTSEDWNSAGFSNYIDFNNELCNYSYGNIVVKETGKYLINTVINNTNGGRTPYFRLYKNGKVFKEYSNGASANSTTRKSLEMDLIEGDSLTGYIYGAGSPTFFITTIYKIVE